MKTTSLQVTEKGLLIPLDYLPDGNEFEVELQDKQVLIRPKKNGAQSTQKEGWPYEWIGIGKTSNPNASVEVEEILMAEIDRRAGWTLDPYPDVDNEDKK